MDDDAAYTSTSPHHAGPFGGGSGGGGGGGGSDDGACAALLDELHQWQSAPRHCLSELLDKNFLVVAKRWLEPCRDAHRTLPPLPRRTEILRLLSVMHELVTLDQIRRTRGLVQTLTTYETHEDECDSNRRLCR